MLKPLQPGENAAWKQRFRAPTVYATQLARRNPARGLAVSNRSGVFQLHAWDVQSGELRQLTDKAAGVVFGGISPDGRYIYYLDDQQGNEIGHYVRVPFEGGEPQDITPDLPPYSSFSLSESLSARWMGFTVAGQDGFRLMVMPRDGQPTLLYHSQRLSVGPLLSFDGEYAVIATTERSQYNNLSLMAFDLTSTTAGQKVLVLQDEDASIQPVSFAPLPGDSRLLAVTNVTGFDRPVIWDVRTGDRTDIPLLGLDGDFAAWDWSPSGKKLLLRQLVQAQYRLYVYDLETSTLNKLSHAGGSFDSGYFYSEDEIFVNVEDATHPSQLVALDAKTGEQTRVVLAASAVPDSRPWKSVMFPSSGGAMIQAWLAVPEGDGPFPTILHTHGGPTAVQTETFSASAQMWLDHGFAWMSVNYRGSTTFGRQFEQAIWGRLGDLEIDDLAAAHHYLVSSGVAIPDAILLEGRSYGGYLTLQGLGRRPELWAGGMAQVAIADWKLMYEDQAEMLRGYQRSLFGGTPDEMPEQHAASSPITYAEKICAPVLVIQGANDTRCPSRQMQVYEQRLKAAGKTIQVEWFDAGHAALAIEQNIDHHELMLRWAYRVLG